MATSIRLEESFEVRLSRLATLTDRPKSFYIRKLFEDYFENLEDYYLAEKADQTPERIYTLDEVVKELGLDR
ncbi:MAG: CopG family transcriptional regulator [Sulfurospirillaceae bacterium]|nr:CopG family transcriptional regulator [Sulfurospirillaceae bacterium]MDD2827455.1 CopG family transcriptional regulator [Sulfurospirillaceae bacterium]